MSLLSHFDKDAIPLDAVGQPLDLGSIVIDRFSWNPNAPAWHSIGIVVKIEFNAPVVRFMERNPDRDEGCQVLVLSPRAVPQTQVLIAIPSTLQLRNILPGGEELCSRLLIEAKALQLS